METLDAFSEIHVPLTLTIRGDTARLREQDFSELILFATERVSKAPFAVFSFRVEPGGLSGKMPNISPQQLKLLFVGVYRAF
jgi:hypothetical protein